METLREFGTGSVGLPVPYLSYMRQGRRFVEGEAITSRIFARHLSALIDWLITVAPHLHRYRSLDEIYAIPCRVVAGAPLLADWLKGQTTLLLVGPDAESEQWVSQIAAHSGQPFIIGNKQRFGDREVQISLPALSAYQQHTAAIIDDVIASGPTILKCIAALQGKGIARIKCAGTYGIFANVIDAQLLAAGLEELATANTIVDPSNAIDISPLPIAPIRECLQEHALGH